MRYSLLIIFTFSLFFFNSCTSDIHPVEAFGGLKLGDTNDNFQKQLDSNPLIESKSGTFQGGSHIIKLDDEYYGDIIHWTKGNIVNSIALNIYSKNGSECLDRDHYYKALKLLSDKLGSDIEKGEIVEKGFYYYSAHAIKNFDNDANNTYIEKGCGKISANWSINNNILEDKKQDNINKNF
jgi:hypothetical protein